MNVEPSGTEGDCGLDPIQDAVMNMAKNLGFGVRLVLSFVNCLNLILLTAKWGVIIVTTLEDFCEN